MELKGRGRKSTVLPLALVEVLSRYPLIEQPHYFSLKFSSCPGHQRQISTL